MQDSLARRQKKLNEKFFYALHSQKVAETCRLTHAFVQLNLLHGRKQGV